MNEFSGATPNEQALYLGSVLLDDHNMTLGALRVPVDAQLTLYITPSFEVSVLVI